MPLYEYHCRTCDCDVELLVRNAAEKPSCPKCGGLKLEKQLSRVAAPSIAGSNLPVCDQPRPSDGTCGRPQCGTGGCMFG